MKGEFPLLPHSPTHEFSAVTCSYNFVYELTSGLLTSDQYCLGIFIVSALFFENDKS